jgi:GAF domain-containing protein
MNAPVPPNENERLAALFRYTILDTPDEPAFDRLTALAARLFKAPVALVTLIDEKRQWFKSCVGTSISETSREVSFCAHAILDDDVTVVPDATADPRFSDNPFVTGPPGVRFYAGAPLKVSEVYNLGTLCILDTVAREFSIEDRKRHGRGRTGAANCQPRKSAINRGDLELEQRSLGYRSERAR